MVEPFTELGKREKVKMDFCGQNAEFHFRYVQFNRFLKHPI